MIHPHFHTFNMLCVYVCVCSMCFLPDFSWMLSDVDPSRVCKGKGVVTLRATLVHIDDEDSVSEESSIITRQSKSE